MKTQKLKYHWSYYRHWIPYNFGTYRTYGGRQLSFEQKQKMLIKQLKDKNIYKIEKDESGKLSVYYNNGRIFRCSGKLVEESGIVSFSKPRIRKLF